MLRQNTEVRTIEISRNHEYFFAICARQRHSYVMVGVTDNDTHEYYHLFSIGKFFVMDNTSPGALYLKMLFSNSRSRLRMESLFYKNATTGEYEQEITDVFSYKAYVFSEEKYLQFLEHVGNCDARASHIYAYQKLDPAEDQQSDKVIFKYLPVLRGAGQKPVFSENAGFNSINNTCRTTAIDMTLDATDMPAKDDALSTSFLSDLPYIGSINNGRLNRNFLVFPMPPEQADISEAVYSILKITYNQLEAIPKKFDDNFNTYLKFNAVRELYRLLDESKHQNISALADIIRNWENRHSYLIDAQRGFSLFSRTSTRTMLDNLREVTRRSEPVKKAQFS